MTRKEREKLNSEIIEMIKELERLRKEKQKKSASPSNRNPVSVALAITKT